MLCDVASFYYRFSCLALVQTLYSASPPLLPRPLALCSAFVRVRATPCWFTRNTARARSFECDISFYSVERISISYYQFLSGLYAKSEMVCRPTRHMDSLCIGNLMIAAVFKIIQNTRSIVPKYSYNTYSIDSML